MSKEVSIPFAKFWSRLINPFHRVDSPPPAGLYRFYLWCLKGAFPVIALGCAASMVAGILEAYSALLLGGVVDHALASGREFFFEQNLWFLLGRWSSFSLCALSLSASVQ